MAFFAVAPSMVRQALRRLEAPETYKTICSPAAQAAVGKTEGNFGLVALPSSDLVAPGHEVYSWVGKTESEAGLPLPGLLLVVRVFSGGEEGEGDSANHWKR